MTEKYNGPLTDVTDIADISPKIMSLHELDSEVEIEDGMTIVGFTDLKQLDTFVNVLAQALKSELAEEYESYDGSLYTAGHPLSQTVANNKPDRFYGKADNIRITILPFDQEFYDSIQSKENINPDSMINFLVERDLFSRVMGTIGIAKTEVAIYVRQRKMGKSQAIKPYIMMTARPRRGEMEKKWGGILRRSNRFATNVWRRGLRNMYSGGLPGLGSRS